MTIQSNWPWPAEPRVPPPDIEGDTEGAARVLRTSVEEVHDITALICSAVPTNVRTPAVWSAGADWCELCLGHRDFQLAQRFARCEDGSLMVDFRVIRLETSLQQQGIATRTIRNSLIAYDHLGVTYVAAYANFSVGGYSWAKLGGVPTEPDIVRGELLARLETPQVRSQYEDEECDALVAAVQESPSDSMMHHIATLAMESETGEPVALGKPLLLGYNWNALWDLTDQSQRRRAAGALWDD